MTRKVDYNIENVFLFNEIPKEFVNSKYKAGDILWRKPDAPKSENLVMANATFLKHISKNEAKVLEQTLKDATKNDYRFVEGVTFLNKDKKTLSYDTLAWIRTTIVLEVQEQLSSISIDPITGDLCEVTQPQTRKIHKETQIIADLRTYNREVKKIYINPINNKKKEITFLE